MKKFLFTLLFILTSLTYSNAEKKRVITNIKVINNVGNHLPRTPICAPIIYLDDFTLFFDTSFSGLYIEVLQSDSVVFSCCIDENGEVALPHNLEGICELHLVMGNIMCLGEFTLPIDTD